MINCEEALKYIDSLKELLEDYEQFTFQYSMIYEDYFNPKPYEFKDLKEGMFVYGYDSNEIYKIDEIVNSDHIEVYITNNMGYSTIHFDEEELYPVHMADVISRKQWKAIQKNR